MFGKERGPRRKTTSFELTSKPMALATGVASEKKQVGSNASPSSSSSSSTMFFYYA